MDTVELPKLFEYYDYRKFLFDWYSAKKKSNRHVTYRYIGMKVDIDPGYLVKVLQGQKHLNPEKLPGFIKLIGLTAREIEYFEILIQFNKAKGEERIRALFEKLLTYNAPESDLVTQDRYEFYQHWFHTAIREVVNTFDVSDNYSEVARMMIPQISTRQVKESLKLLTRLGFIYQDESGIFQQNNQFITTGPEWHSIAIRQFHRQVIELAHDAVGNVPTAERDLSCLTMTLTDIGLTKIKDRLVEFRQEVLDICAQESGVDRVYQMNFQLFPMSKKAVNRD